MSFNDISRELGILTKGMSNLEELCEKDHRFIFSKLESIEKSVEEIKIKVAVMQGKAIAYASALSLAISVLGLVIGWHPWKS